MADRNGRGKQAREGEGVDEQAQDGKSEDDGEGPEAVEERSLNVGEADFGLGAGLGQHEQQYRPHECAGEHGGEQAAEVGAFHSPASGSEVGKESGDEPFVHAVPVEVVEGSGVSW
jgi:hypothetical protein